MMGSFDCLGFCLQELYWAGTKATLNPWCCRIQCDSDRDVQKLQGGAKCVDLAVNPAAGKGQKHHYPTLSHPTSPPRKFPQAAISDIVWLSAGAGMAQTGTVWIIPFWQGTETSTSADFLATCSVLSSHRNSSNVQYSSPVQRGCVLPKWGHSNEIFF